MTVAVTVTAPPVFANITTALGVVAVEVQGPVSVAVAVVGIQGQPGPGVSGAGAGLVLIGNELRFAISSLTRG